MYIYADGDNEPMCGEFLDLPTPNLVEGKMFIMEQVTEDCVKRVDIPPDIV